ATGADAFQRVIQEKYEAAILFQIQRAELQKKALTTAEVAALQNKISSIQANDSLKVSSLGLSAYASPDGPADLNEKLAANRKKNTEDFLTKELKKSKIDATVDAKYIAEDWDGFQELMMQSDIQDKELILRVLSMYNDPAQREKEIKNLSAAYTKIADQILPQLRRSKLELVVDVIGKSDEQILAIAKAEPSKLSLEELLYGASIATSASEKAYITGQAISLFPEDWRAYNNLATLKFADGNVDEAKALLATAVAKGGDQPQVNFNLGLVELTAKNYKKAQEYFGKSAGVGEALAEAQGVAYIQSGEYNKAVTAFGNSTSNNAALANLLAGNYQKATAVVDAVKNPTADTYYLKALIGARSSNKDQVISSLTKAIQADKSYAKKAACDIEFAKYLIDSDFLAIVK
ncbi:MAG TPA: tetratricopeptide repeat protein, partial [Paludibacteraceae bacterium]|nr:tetratricopeptide repeat protein [Paludibacteraceae bacterium]